ncbi:hypothetical protein M422DRAFT_255002 [Sphaerobolus stellatus SS14]|uniref:SMP domain-containing protein n=1 Tax=Sphaerobolus stellatus (strain SS14) TaxID=990650 RepID=A0A0C9T1L7_SPHS4|nr:hypothetical protein M422DRAFT_276855 [Sphaerobolus stellatus SS14]KIJ41981.1 hypothetical protein M422DRAFT_255002 [Sphaerobolus stellatus SS14]
MTTINSAHRNDALLEAAATRDAMKIAAERGENVNIDIDPTTLNKGMVSPLPPAFDPRVEYDVIGEAAKLMSEEHRILGYRPPAGSLAAQAQAAATKNGNEGGIKNARDEAKLAAAAAEDALRISAERGQNINVNVNPAALSKDEAAKIMSEEHRILGHRPPAGSLAAQAQSAADKKENDMLSRPITKDIASEIQSQEHKGIGHRPPEGKCIHPFLVVAIRSLAAQAQFLADKNANDGGDRTIDPTVLRVVDGAPVTKGLAADLMSLEEKALGDLPKGSLASQAQSAADQNAQDGGKRSVYEAMS